MQVATNQECDQVADVVDEAHEMLAAAGHVVIGAMERGEVGFRDLDAITEAEKAFGRAMDTLKGEFKKVENL